MEGIVSRSLAKYSRTKRKGKKLIDVVSLSLSIPSKNLEILEIFQI